MSMYVVVFCIIKRGAGWGWGVGADKIILTLLSKDTVLSTSRFLYKSVPDDKHSDTPFSKPGYK